MKYPLAIRMQQAKQAILTAVNQAGTEQGIPAFLMEGILADISQQVSARAGMERLADLDRANAEGEEGAAESIEQ